jgi:hypothetical protein
MKRLSKLVLGFALLVSAPAFASNEALSLLQSAAYNAAVDKSSNSNVLGWKLGDSATYYMRLTNNRYIQHGSYVCDAIETVTSETTTTMTTTLVADYCRWAKYDNSFYRSRWTAVAVYSKESGKLLSYIVGGKPSAVVDSTLNTLSSEETTVKTADGQKYNATKTTYELVMPNKTHKGVMWTNPEIPVFGNVVRAEWYNLGIGWNYSVDVLGYTVGN